MSRIKMSEAQSASFLAGMIDHTFLKAFGTAEDIERLCQEALHYGFATVTVNPAEVTSCVRLLEGSAVRVGAVIGFPLGQNTSTVKAFEMRDAIQNGAREIDMVINIRALQSGDSLLVRREIAGMCAACRTAEVTSKVILETCYLTDAQKEQVCGVAVDEGADFVKTSTGLGTAGATVADVRLMRGAVGPDVGVKAAGGIRDLAMALAMIEAGADRLGTSASVAIMEEAAAKERRAQDGPRV